jgi:two-component system, sensor histidine kinase FlrB
VQILPANMTSLPISPGWTEHAISRPPSGASASCIGDPAVTDEQGLLRAFRSFAKVAGSLQQSYGQLQSEVERLRRELAERDGELANTLEEKRNEKARLLRILEGLPCGVLVTLGTDRIWKANPEAWRLLAACGDSECAGSISELRAQLQEFLKRVQSEDRELEIELKEPAAPSRWIAARHAPLGAGMAVFILRDITEHKCLEETQAKLRRDQALAELSAILAHEVRNPLGSLELFAGLLAEAGLEGEPRQWVERVQAGLRGLAATVNNVLQFHSPSRPEFSSVEVEELLEWVLLFCGPLARQSGVTLSLQNRAAGMALRGDRHCLEQVLLNLVLNSIRVMPDGGWIEVGGGPSAEGNTIELTVADTGPGIPAECLSRIFEPGFSLRAGSPGLGLAVCRKIVEQHSGTIRACSTPQRGTTIRLSFPVCEEAVR